MQNLSELISETGWSLFLDRDGVINQRIPNDYVKYPEQFVFNEGVPEALKIFSQLFTRIFIVTNQQGIGRGLMTSAELLRVHNSMLAKITESGGRVDRIYFSPDLKNTRSFTRKPAVGMGLKARREFPEIRFRKCIMAGDTPSDMLFGKRLGMITVLISDEPAEIRASGEMHNYIFPDLISFALNLTGQPK